MSEQPTPGQDFGPYRLEQRLGGGGFGEVWLAHDRETGEKVALKLLAALEAAEARAEIEQLAALASGRSSHVVRVLGGGLEPVPHIVMEYIDGPTLADLLTERGKLPIAEVIDLGLALADALAALEAAGIIHRDVKPANVMIDSRGVVKLTDFGIAKIVGYATVTTSRAAPMTMAYSAPEVWDGEPTSQSDVYALGILLYQCLAGDLPFSGSPGQLYTRHRAELPDLTRLPHETPASLRALVGECLQKDQALRPSGAAVCTAMLERAKFEYEEASSTLRTSSEPARFGPWVRKGPHPTIPWAWVCTHETTGKLATVEVHSFPIIEEHGPLRRAYEANAALMPFGAEELLGTNRLLLRRDEAWSMPPSEPFQFWVARREVDKTPAPTVTPQVLGTVVEDVAGLINAAEKAGVQVSFAPDVASVGADGRFHLERPGLVAASSPARDQVMAFLRQLPLDDDARGLINDAPDLAGLSRHFAAASVEAGVARAAAGAESLDTAQIISTGFARVDVGELTATPTAVPTTQPAEPELAPDVDARAASLPLDKPPRRRRAAAVILVAAVLAGVAVGGIAIAAVALGTRHSSNASNVLAASNAGFDIKNVDCQPSTAEVGKPVTCNVVLGGGNTDKLIFAWAAGDGDPASASSASFTTQFASAAPQKQITLKVCSADGTTCKDGSATLSVNDAGAEAPSAAFDCVPSPAKPGEPVTCHSLLTGSDLTYQWMAPGGTTTSGSGTTFTTQFQSGSMQTVSLALCKTTAGNTACATTSQPIPVTQQPTNSPTAGSGTGATAPPTIPAPSIASMSCAPVALHPGDTTSCSVSVTGQATDRTWIAAGGNPASGNAGNFTTSFTTVGTKSIVFQTCNGLSCDSRTQTVTVSELIFTIKANCGPLSLLTNQGVSCFGGVTSGPVTADSLTWTWNAPGGTPPSGTSISFNTSFASAGQQSISVTACTGLSCAVDRASINVQAPTPTPTPTATATPTSTPTVTPTPWPTPTPIPPPTIAPTATPVPLHVETYPVIPAYTTSETYITFGSYFDLNTQDPKWGGRPVHIHVRMHTGAGQPGAARIYIQANGPTLIEVALNDKAPDQWEDFDVAALNGSNRYELEIHGHPGWSPNLNVWEGTMTVSNQ